jgi:hypothetical protein
MAHRGQCCQEAQLLSCDTAANPHATVAYGAPDPLGLYR